MEAGTARRSWGGLVLGVLTAFALVVVIATLLAQGVLEARSEAAIEVGQPAPPFEMERYGGGTVSLEDFRGKVLMIDFWASWCAPCKKEMPLLLRLAEEFSSRGLAFVAANTSEEAADRKAAVGVFIAQTDPELAKYAVYATDEMARTYGVSVLPTLVLIDRQGTVAFIHDGELREKELRPRIHRAVMRR